MCTCKHIAHLLRHLEHLPDPFRLAAEMCYRKDPILVRARHLGKSKINLFRQKNLQFRLKYSNFAMQCSLCAI